MLTCAILSTIQTGLEPDDAIPEIVPVRAVRIVDDRAARDADALARGGLLPRSVERVEHRASGLDRAARNYVRACRQRAAR